MIDRAFAEYLKFKVPSVYIFAEFLADEKDKESQFYYPALEVSQTYHEEIPCGSGRSTYETKNALTGLSETEGKLYMVLESYTLGLYVVDDATYSGKENVKIIGDSIANAIKAQKLSGASFTITDSVTSEVYSIASMRLRRVTDIPTETDKVPFVYRRQIIVDLQYTTNTEQDSTPVTGIDFEHEVIE